MTVQNQSFEGDGSLYKMQQEAIRRAYEYNSKYQKTNPPENTYKHENEHKHEDEYKVRKEDFIIDEEPCREPSKEPPKKKGGLFGNIFGGNSKDNTLFGNFSIEDLIIIGIIFLILFNSDDEPDWLTIIALGFLFIVGI